MQKLFLGWISGDKCLGKDNNYLNGSWHNLSGSFRNMHNINFKIHPEFLMESSAQEKAA